jgi:archaellum biogenesis ATPase FlaH
MYTYQHALYDKLQAGGFKQGEIMLFAAGRQTGKSMFNQMYGSMMKPVTEFEITAKAEVDGATWYTVSCTKDISEWLRSQSRELQYEALAHGFHFPQFDIHEKLYILLALKWS